MTSSKSHKTSYLFCHASSVQETHDTIAFEHAKFYLKNIRYARLATVWLSTHRKDPLGLRARQNLVFKNRSVGRVGNFLPL